MEFDQKLKIQSFRTKKLPCHSEVRCHSSMQEDAGHPGEQVGGRENNNWKKVD
jgi:hypothetical protein